MNEISSYGDCGNSWNFDSRNRVLINYKDDNEVYPFTNDMTVTWETFELTWGLEKMRIEWDHPRDGGAQWTLKLCKPLGLDDDGV